MDRSEAGSPGNRLARESATMNWAAALYDLVTPLDYDWNAQQHMREQFLRFGYVKLPGFISAAALQLIKNELDELARLSRRRDFIMPGYATPRSLSVLSGSMIKAHSPFLYSLYHHYALRRCVENIVGRTVYSCTHPEEYMVANFLHHQDDTHGWHLDDPPYALVIFAEIPGENDGGALEVVANWTDLCRRKNRKPDQAIDDLISWAEENGLVDRHYHQAGDAYLLRADVNLHRVSPLVHAGSRRAVVNLAFQCTAVAHYGATANLLYSAESDHVRRP
ncbi:HalD/BesD family halogenase [Paraburkholderia solisilvae]|uniref:L-lysine 4-chlorinase n=1 Tax=Paraburkholderia solisilvae TaxID=624376 RepID=A0A6J5E1H7_9BURK|nr:hypothetical protein [Paraburkholderia solisilvae]CAB3759584.1 L-lysine 4-chlorinase [Paraburkholderia solisilvae]